MENVRKAFDVLTDGKSVSIGNQFMQCHMVFDIKMEDFRRKVKLVAGDYMIKALGIILYANIVSRESF